MKALNSLPGAFIGKTGNLYIRVRKILPEGADLYTTQTAVYPSVESYNARSAVPHYVELSTVVDDYQSAVSINMTTLTIAVDDKPSNTEVFNLKVKNLCISFHPIG